MKHIVFLTAGLTSGGAEHQMTILMDLLVEKGYIVTLVSFGDVPDHYTVKENVRRVHLAPGKSTKRKVSAVEWFLLKEKMDVLFAFSQRMSVLSLFVMLLRPKVKVISGERSYSVGRATRFEKILLKTGIYRRANYIVPNSYSQGRYLSSLRPYLKKRIHVITNYTDLNQYVPSATHHNDILKIGIFGRFEKPKNFVTFVESMAILKQRISAPILVEWYGNHRFENPSQVAYFNEGVALIEKNELQEMIQIHDQTNRVSELIPTFDALCLPSLFEGFSNTISEYICCGRPVLCSDVSDNSVMVHDGENGYLFDPEDVESIVVAFQKFISLNSAEREAMGLKSREIAESLFDKERFIAEYMNLIEH